VQHDRQVGKTAAQEAEHRQTIGQGAAGHGVVGHQHVTGGPFEQVKQGVAVGRGAHHLQPRNRAQQRLQAGQDGGMVIGEQDAHAAATPGLAGSVAGAG